MMEFLQYPNEILTKKCPVYNPSFFYEDLADACEMSNVMLALKSCVGIAAPQFGISKRFFIMREGVKGIRFCFDPQILNHGRDIEFGNEKCMSLPGVRVSVPRWRIVSVEYRDHNFEQVFATLRGLEARTFQHELDHLNGRLIIKTDADINNG